MEDPPIIRDLASELWGLAQVHAGPVISQGRANASPNRQIAAFAYAQYMQGATAPSLFHLPEPLLHPFANPKVLVIGVNPGYGIDERMPTLESTLEDYIRFYADRFGPQGRNEKDLPAVELIAKDLPAPKRSIGHLVKVERLLEPALGSCSLGREAVFCDAIPWKWNNYRDPSKKHLQPSLPTHEWAEVWKDASSRVGKIATSLKPRVVVILGELSSRLFGLKLTRGPYVLRAEIGSWSGTVVASLHPNANQYSNAYQSAVAIAIQQHLS
jgi:hypothetical protein